MITFDTSELTAAIKQAADRLGDALGEKTLRATGFAGAEVFRDEAKVNALRNVKTGVLYRNIIVKRLEEDSDAGARQSYLVTVRGGTFGTDGDAYYWRFVERGHKFVRRVRKDESLAGNREASALEYGTSSAPAYPFMRPAFESKKRTAIEAMQSALLAAVKKQMEGGT